MIILVKTADGRIVSRPDTTWRRSGDDIYPPDFVERLSYSPILFARISRAGRSVEAGFAERYYSGIGYGMLLYAENLIDGSAEGYAEACCLDYTTILPAPLYNKLTLGIPENEFLLLRDGEELLRYGDGDAGMIADAICLSTRFSHIRIGDVVALELRGRQPLCSRDNPRTRIQGSYCGNRTIDFEIVF